MPHGDMNQPCNMIQLRLTIWGPWSNRVICIYIYATWGRWRSLIIQSNVDTPLAYHERALKHDPMQACHSMNVNAYYNKQPILYKKFLKYLESINAIEVNLFKPTSSDHWVSLNDNINALIPTKGALFW